MGGCSPVVKLKHGTVFKSGAAVGRGFRSLRLCSQMNLKYSWRMATL